MQYFAIPIIVGVITALVTGRHIIAAISTIAAIMFAYIEMPVYDVFHFGGIYAVIAVQVAAFAVTAFIVYFICNANLESEEEDKFYKYGIGVVIFFALIGVIGGISTMAMFNSYKYQQVFGKVNHEAEFTEETAPLDLTQMRDVNQGLATRLGKKRLGEIPGLGSEMELEEMSLQLVNGKLYWVGLLDYNGFFRWFGNEGGTQGYIKVSATNDQDVELVTQIDGKDMRIKYNKGAYFGEYPQRYLYEHGYSTTGITDFSTEIDDSGRPFYVVTKYEKRVGFSGSNATGVITLDVQTGEIKEYSIDDAPLWIDRIQPEQFIVDQITWWGKYVHGFWNLRGKDKLMPTNGTSLVYGGDGHSYWYTGITSIGKDDATVGFMLVNTRTKDVHFFKQPGGTEESAMGSAQGEIQEKGYDATFPVLYNVNGVPTYYMTLKDQAGLVKMRAFVSVENIQNVGVAPDRREALRKYMTKLSSNGNRIAPESLVTAKTSSGKVLRFQPDVQNGNTFYYIILEGQSKFVFVGSSSVSQEIPLTNIGDTVTIGYDEGHSGVIDIRTYDNKMFEIRTNTEHVPVAESQQ